MDRASGSSSSHFRLSFDVFLSFRGEDTRSNFTSHLNMALHQRRINVFIDNKLSRGEEISASLLEAIEESKISVVIISENYASSSWCLDELRKIIMCKESRGQDVFPVFYKVDPSQVRKQSGTFGEAFAKLEVRFPNDMQEWRKALTTVSNMAGWVTGKDDEASLIQKIVQEIWKKLNRSTIQLHIAKYPVGVDIQIMSLLSHVMSDGITMVGLYGIGGMGKTTLAKALYNRIAHDFEGCCFLANIREASNQYGGLVQLQNELLCEILIDSIKVSNLHRGNNIITDRLCSKKILLILDDVDTREQLQALAGGPGWFGAGSKVIVTTRNKQLLASHGFDILQSIQGLNDDEAIELFSWHAFKNNHPSSDYLDLSKRVVHYCKGLPLALEVLGSFLCSIDQSKFECILDEYENSYLDKDIQDLLQISYDGLEDHVKEIFLYISCFFVREDIDTVKMKLNACGNLCLEKGITKLMNLSLMSINEFNEVEMHDLIQQMGYTIALSENSKSRKRLLIDNDAMDVLNGNEEARAVKAIKLDFRQPTELNMDSRAFEKCKNLVVLKVQNATSSKSTLDFLPSSLRWMSWSRFPFSSLPSSYKMDNLIELNLPYSSIKHFGKAFMSCELLKRIDLQDSMFLEEVPDLSAATNLMVLSLLGCTNLVKVHESVGSLSNLVLLELSSHDSGFKQFPHILRLKSLRTLTFVECNLDESYPHFSEEMQSLNNLMFDGCTISELSPTIGNLTELKDFIIYCTKITTLPSTIYGLTNLNYFFLNTTSISTFPPLFPCAISLLSNLTQLNLSNNSLTNLDFLETIAHVVPSLRELNLSDNYFLNLPSYIVNFKSLRILDVMDCELLEEIPKIPEDITFLNAGGCISLVRFPDNLVDFISCDSEHYSKQVLLMNCDIPEWFSQISKNNPITFSMRLYPGQKLKAVAPCVKFQVNYADERWTTVKCNVSIDNIQVWSSEEAKSVHEPEESKMLLEILPYEYMWLIVLHPDTDFSPAWDDFMEKSSGCNRNDDDDCNNSTTSIWKEFRMSFEVTDKRFLEGEINISMCGVHVVIQE